MDISKIKEFISSWVARIPLSYFNDPDPVVSVLRLSGVIGLVGPGRSGLTLDGLEKSIERAFSGKRVKAVALGHQLARWIAGSVGPDRAPYSGTRR